MNESRYTQSTKNNGDDYFIYDRWKRKYHFKITIFIIPTGMDYNAIEVKKDDSVGYEFNAFYSLDYDHDLAMEEFIDKIKKGLNQRHIRKRGSEWEIGARNMLRGRIAWSENSQDTEFEKVLIIDGKRFTIEEFAHMIDHYEGFNFEFRIKDPSD